MNVICQLSEESVATDLIGAHERIEKWNHESDEMVLVRDVDTFSALKTEGVRIDFTDGDQVELGGKTKDTPCTTEIISGWLTESEK